MRTQTQHPQNNPAAWRAAGAFLPALLAMALAACQSSSGPVVIAPPANSSDVTLHPGDVIQISFPSSADLNQSQKIPMDGRINLPMVGEVKASGKTLLELQDDLEADYKPDLATDQVVVNLVSTETSIYVTGAVNKPGDIEFDRPMTVLDAVMESGGFSFTANTGRVHLIRQSGGQEQTIFLDLRPEIRGQPSKSVYLQAGDIIYVPEKVFNF